MQVFLRKGEKAVLVNFGSAEQTAKSFRALLKHTVDTLQNLGHRVVVISKTPMDEYAQREGIYFCRYAPHATLLPQVKAIVHRGGIGTVCASLKNAVPQIIVPQGMDQYF